MSDLSQSLIDAAAEALRDARFVDPDDDTMPTFQDRTDPEEGRFDVWKPTEVAASVAVVAVLETLADTACYSEDCGMEVWHPPGLRGLAAEIRGQS